MAADSRELNARWCWRDPFSGQVGGHDLHPSVFQRGLQPCKPTSPVAMRGGLAVKAESEEWCGPEPNHPKAGNPVRSRRRRRNHSRNLGNDMPTKERVRASRLAEGLWVCREGLMH
jgi:hypothetical protein